jgi:hypothetical protein
MKIQLTKEDIRAKDLVTRSYREIGHLEVRRNGRIKLIWISRKQVDRNGLVSCLIAGHKWYEPVTWTNVLVYLESYKN